MRGLLCGLIFLVMVSCSYFVDHNVRTCAQHHKLLYEVMLASDYMSFVSNGGGALGYQNYFKWCYAKGINSPDQAIIIRLAFWNHGFFYDAMNPPDEYQYPLRV